ncbi:MAG: diguanylate cyclase [Gemmataceae bacterium]
MEHFEPGHALGILVVTEDGELARELSHFLNMAHYHTLEAGTPQTALAALETGRVQVALLDENLASRDRWALCRLLCEPAAPLRPFKFLLVRQPDKTQLQEGLEAGIDDFLVVPVCFGELLARLRAAARVLEFDRRARQQDPVDAVTGLHGRTALVAELHRAWGAGGAASRVACAVFDLDFFAAARRLLGVAGANSVLAAVAELLQAGEQMPRAATVYSLGGDRFAAVLPGANAAEACAWAERAGEAIAARPVTAGKASCQLTASFGVASCESAETPDQLLEQANAALASAKASGRNCAVRYNEFAGEAHLGSTAGRLFERTVARDVLMPCSLVLQPGETIEHAAQLLRRSHLEAAPVVDAGGKLLGLFKPDQVALASAGGHASRQVRESMSDVRHFQSHEELATLMEFFNQDPLAWAVVVQDGRPLGLLNCDSLLALSHPVRIRDAASQPDTLTTDYLLVADVCQEECTSQGA